jgi:hypothetical protein
LTLNGIRTAGVERRLLYQNSSLPIVIHETIASGCTVSVREAWRWHDHQHCINSSISPETLNAVYGASKAYVIALSDSLQHELADKGIRIQAVLPGATATDLWEIAGLPWQSLPPEIVMSAEDMVDAALAGLDQGELVTIPGLQDGDEWTRFEAARSRSGSDIPCRRPDTGLVYLLRSGRDAERVACQRRQLEPRPNADSSSTRQKGIKIGRVHIWLHCKAKLRSSPAHHAELVVPRQQRSPRLGHVFWFTTDAQRRMRNR